MIMNDRFYKKCSNCKHSEETEETDCLMCGAVGLYTHPTYICEEYDEREDAQDDNF